MNWKIKAHSLAVLSRLPAGRQMYHWLQRCAGTNKLQVETLERHHHFSILLDGEIYGPFYRVRITPCKIPHMRGETLKLPVMHHLPFQM